MLETVRDGPRLVAALQRAADARRSPVVVLPVGGSPLGSALVAAHSGALAGERAGVGGVLRRGRAQCWCATSPSSTDTLELFAAGTACPRPAARIATVHDSGAERALVADLAHELGVPFAPLSPTRRCAGSTSLLDDGLIATNPLDLWGPAPRRVSCSVRACARWPTTRRCR